ncbi:hypothetical protein Tco_1101884 [Tanacetum coccineum]
MWKLEVYQEDTAELNRKIKIEGIEKRFDVGLTTIQQKMVIGFSTHLASVVKSWLVHDQTVHALASPKANELTIPEQTATGKGTSNPLMAGSLPKTTKPT